MPIALMVNCAVSLIFETLAWWLAPAQRGVSIDDAAPIMHRLLLSIQTF